MIFLNCLDISNDLFNFLSAISILKADENSLKVINDRETIYLYKRYKPIELDLE